MATKKAPAKKVAAKKAPAKKPAVTKMAMAVPPPRGPRRQPEGGGGKGGADIVRERDGLDK